jgi:putative acetyltransferase
MELELRLERPEDYREVENLTREAFWDVHVPGCDEHYLAHVMRSHPDFLPELDHVAVSDGRIVGNIMYTRARLEAEGGESPPVLSFGPLSVLPGFQRKGIGSRLVERTVELVSAMGYAAIVIFGNPGNYVKFGFRNCRKLRVAMAPEVYPTGMLVLELRSGALGSKDYVYVGSEVYAVDEAAARSFDSGFPPKERGWRPSQEEFDMLSRSLVQK